MGTALRERLGVRPEERVLLLMLDSPEMIYSFFGAIKIGAVPVPINTLWTPADYEFVLHDARPRVVIVTDSLRPRIVDAVRRCSWVRHLVVFGEAGDGEIGFDELVGSGLRELEAESTSADAPAFWLYLVRQHWLAEGLRAPPARHARLRQQLRAWRAGDCQSG